MASSSTQSNLCSLFSLFPSLFQHRSALFFTLSAHLPCRFPQISFLPAQRCLPHSPRWHFHTQRTAGSARRRSGREGREGEMSSENPPLPVPRLPTNELWGRPALLKPRGEKTSCNSDPPSLDAPIPQPPLRSRRRLRAAIWKMQPMSGEGEEWVWEEDGLSGRPWSRERKERYRDVEGRIKIQIEMPPTKTTEREIVLRRRGREQEQTLFNDLRQGPFKGNKKDPYIKEGVPLHFEIIVRN